jgi:hypothetical protein
MNKNGFIVMQKPKIGNFISNSCCSQWNISHDNNLDFIIDENGKYSFCFCKNDFTDKKSITMQTKMNYDSKIEFNYELFKTNASIVVTLLQGGRMKKVKLGKEQKLSEELNKNDEIIIKINCDDAICGEIIGIINNIEILLNEYEEIKIDYNKFISNIKH